MECIYLAVIKSAIDGKVMHIGVGNGSHLRFLNGRDTTLGVKDEDRDVGLVTETVDGSTVIDISSMAT